jgi:hypothetical protein
MKTFILFFSFSLTSTLIIAQNLIKHSEFYFKDKKGIKITKTFSSLQDFDNSGYAVFSIGGNASSNYGRINGAKYGIINNNGEIIIDSKYDYLDKLFYNNDSIYAFIENDLVGLISISGRIIVPAKYKSIEPVYSNESIVLAKKDENSIQLLSIIDGYPKSFKNSSSKVDSNSNTWMQSFRIEGKGFVFQQAGLFGFMSKDLKIIVPAIYNELEVLENDVIKAQDKKLKTFLLNSKGEMISKEKYDEIEVLRFSDYKISGYVVKKRGKEGFINSTNELLIPVQYSKINRIEIGCNDYILVGKNSKDECLLYNKSGKQITSRSFKEIETNLIFNKFVIVKLTSKKKKKKKKKDSNSDFDFDFEIEPTKTELIDLTGKSLINGKIDDYKIPYYENQKLLILKVDGNYIAYDKNLTPILKSQVPNDPYTYIDHLSNDLYIVQLGGDDQGWGKPEGGVFGLFSEDGVQILPITFEDISMAGYGDNLKLLIKKMGKYGIYNSNGEKILDHLYSKLTCNDNICNASIYDERSGSEKFGLINISAQTATIPFKYDYLSEYNYSSKKYIAKVNDKFGVVNENGDIILGFKYNYLVAANTSNNDLFIVNKYGSVKEDYYGGLQVEGGNFGVINSKGDTVVPIIYTKIDFMNDSILSIIDNNNKMYFLHFPSLKSITTMEAEYINLLGYNYKNQKYVIARNGSRNEYNEYIGGEYGITDLTGKILVDFNYSDIKESQGYFICNYLDFNGMDLIDENGKKIVEKADYIQSLSDSVFVIDKGGNISLFNVKTKESNLLNGAIEYKMKDSWYSKNSLVGVKSKENKWGIINKNGEWLIEPKYCDIVANDKYFVIAAICDGISYKYGVIDMENNILIPFEFDTIIEDYNDVFRCVQGEKLFFKNLMNEILKTDKATEENLR